MTPKGLWRGHIRGARVRHNPFGVERASGGSGFAATLGSGPEPLRGSFGHLFASATAAASEYSVSTLSTAWLLHFDRVERAEPQREDLRALDAFAPA